MRNLILPDNRRFTLLLACSLALHAVVCLSLARQRHPGALTIPDEVVSFDLRTLINADSSPTPLPAPATATEEPMPTADVPLAPTVTHPHPAPPLLATPLQQQSLSTGLRLGTFRSLANGESLRDEIRVYYFAMLQRFNENWWLLGGGKLAGVQQEVTVNVVIGRDGRIVSRTLLGSSGSPEFDKAVLQAVDLTSPLPPLPPTYRGDLFQAPLRLALPLGLLAPDA